MLTLIIREPELQSITGLYILKTLKKIYSNLKMSQIQLHFTFKSNYITSFDMPFKNTFSIKSLSSCYRLEKIRPMIKYIILGVQIAVIIFFA